MPFLSELKRRNVAKTAMLYIVASWLLLQVTDVLTSLLPVPEWTGSLVVTLLVVGFLPALIFSWIYELTPEGLKHEKEVAQGESISHQTGRKINILIVVLLVLAIGVVVVDRLIPETGTPSSASVTDETTLPHDETGRSIAVLPFVNMSNDPDQEYFSDGISEELLNVLAQYDDLRVAARTSSFQFKDQNLDVAEIATKLNVNHVLEGSVRKAGNRIRITAQLIEADTGYHLWSDTYDRDLDDVFAIQDEISAAIGLALQTELALTGGSVPQVSEAGSTEAFEAYMRGRQLIHLRGRQNLDRAVTELQRALQLDETYAPAHAQMAIAVALLGNSPGSYGDLTLQEVMARAVPHIERALELDPQLSEGYAARTLLGLATSDYESAIANGRRALELNPSNAEVLNWMFISRGAQGKPAAAMQILEQQISVDPLTVVGRMNLASRLAYREDLHAAIRMSESLAETSRAISYATSGKIYYYYGDLVEALRLFMQAYALDARDTITSTGLARTLGQLNLVAEGLRLPDKVHVWVYWNRGMWPELVANARDDMNDNPTDPYSKLLLADALHLSGDVEQAQGFYEELLAGHPGRPVSDLINESVAPTARAAFGRLASGQTESAGRLANLVTDNLEQRRQAWLTHQAYYRASAIVAVVRGDEGEALDLIREAARQGPHDPTLFSEPAFEGVRDSATFRAIEAEFWANLEAQRKAARQMLCFDNPTPDAWPVLPDTCEGVGPQQD